MTDDIVAFVRSRLDEDERVACAVGQPHDWHQGDRSDPWAGSDEDMVYMWPPEHHTPFEEDKHWRGLQADDAEQAAHIARHDPARILREVEAKRAILAACAEYDDCPAGMSGSGLAYHVEELLALPYADHPDYREEWRP